MSDEDGRGVLNLQSSDQDDHGEEAAGNPADDDGFNRMQLDANNYDHELSSVWFHEMNASNCWTAAAATGDHNYNLHLQLLPCEFQVSNACGAASINPILLQPAAATTDHDLLMAHEINNVFEMGQIRSSVANRKRDYGSVEVMQIGASRDQNDDEEIGEDNEMNDGLCKIQPKRARFSSTQLHNFNERLRRQKIKDKMKALQDLIPNCNKRDKASTLDDAIKYIKALQYQLQREMMSMGAGDAMNKYSPNNTNQQLPSTVHDELIPISTRNFPSNPPAAAAFLHETMGLQQGMQVMSPLLGLQHTTSPSSSTASARRSRISSAARVLTSQVILPPHHITDDHMSNS